MSTGPAAAEQSTRSPFVTATQIIASLLSLAGLVYIFGALVLWVRLARSDLPSDVVSALPRELVIGVGLKSVVAPSVLFAFIAAFGFVAVTYAVRFGKLHEHRMNIATTHGVLAFAGGTIVIGGVFLLAALSYGRPLTTMWIWAALAIAVLSLALVIGWFAKKVVAATSWGPGTIALLAAILGLVGAFGRIVLEAADPRLEDAVVCLAEGEAYPGLLIGEASSSVYLGQRLPNEPNVVVSISKDRVQEVWIGEGVREDRC
jgi:hypothetical protein